MLTFLFRVFPVDGSILILGPLTSAEGMSLTASPAGLENKAAHDVVIPLDLVSGSVADILCGTSCISVPLISTSLDTARSMLGTSRSA